MGSGRPASGDRESLRGLARRIAVRYGGIEAAAYKCDDGIAEHLIPFGGFDARWSWPFAQGGHVTTSALPRLRKSLVLGLFLGSVAIFGSRYLHGREELPGSGPLSGNCGRSPNQLGRRTLEDRNSSCLPSLAKRGLRLRPAPLRGEHRRLDNDEDCFCNGRDFSHFERRSNRAATGFVESLRCRYEGAMSQRATGPGPGWSCVKDHFDVFPRLAKDLCYRAAAAVKKACCPTSSNSVLA